MYQLKNLLLLVSFLFSCYQPVFGQLTTSKKSKNKTWVIKNNAPSNLVRVEIQAVNDSSFTALMVNGAMTSTLKTYDIKDVKKIKFKSKKKIIRNVVIGTTIGAFIGASFLEAWRKKDPYGVSKSDVFNSGLIAGIIGGAIGYGVGSIKIKIPINGQQSKYKKKRKKIIKHAFKK